jgi:hypothetical protein
MVRLSLTSVRGPVGVKPVSLKGKVALLSEKLTTM